MYAGAKSRVRVNNPFNTDFKVQDGVHQGSVLSPLLFTVVLDVRTGCPWELLYADYLVVVSESLEGVLEKLRVWRLGLESKGLKVSMRETKVMFCSPNLNTLKDSGKYPCGVCHSEVGCIPSFAMAVLTGFIIDAVTSVVNRLQTLLIGAAICFSNARPIDATVCDHVVLDNQKLEVVDSFCYLGDSNFYNPWWRCEAATMTRSRCAWGKFREH